MYNVEAYYQEVQYRLQLADKRAGEFLNKVKVCRKLEYDLKVKELHLKIREIVTLTNENRNKFDPWYNLTFSMVKDMYSINMLRDNRGKCIIVNKNMVQTFVRKKMYYCKFFSW